MCRCRCDGTAETSKVCFQYKLLDILRYMASLLRDNNIPFWLGFGTLLGAVREGKIIPWDTDIDLGFWEKDAEKIIGLTDTIKKDGYGFRVRNAGDTILQIIIGHSPNCTRSLCMDSWRVDGFLAECIEYPNSNCPAQCLDKENMIELEFEGEKLPAPAQPEIILKNFYGADWKTPRVRNYDKIIVSMFGPSNAQAMAEIEKCIQQGNCYD